MTKHGDQIRSLAESPLVGSRFKDFIARWEMNIEPPPVEKIEKCVACFLAYHSILTSRPRPATPQRWGHSRLLDTTEEDYFNADDDDDEPIPILVSTPPPRGMLTGKRKRPPRTGIPIRAAPNRAPYPHPNAAGVPRAPSLGSLVGDYGDGDDAAGADEGQPTPTPGRASPIPSGFVPLSYNAAPPPSPSPSPSPSPPGDAPPASTRLAHRQVSVKSQLSLDDDGDILEDLERGGPRLPRISGMSDVSAGVGSKRRRGDVDDDDDELLERLANKAKRPTPSPGPGDPLQHAKARLGDSDSKPSPGAAKGGGGGTEEGPKKLKLKFGVVGAAVASSPAPKGGSSPSSTGTKDGDNG